MTEPTKRRGGARPGAGRKPKPGDPLTDNALYLRLTQKQADYLACAAVLKLDPQDMVRAALDRYIDEQIATVGGQA